MAANKHLQQAQMNLAQHQEEIVQAARISLAFLKGCEMTWPTIFQVGLLHHFVQWLLTSAVLVFDCTLYASRSDCSVLCLFATCVSVRPFLAMIILQSSMAYMAKCLDQHAVTRLYFRCEMSAPHKTRTMLQALPTLHWTVTDKDTIF